MGIGLQVTNGSTELTDSQNSDGKAQAQKRLVEELQVQWKLLWSERFDDKQRAEGVSVKDYNKLYVEQGTIINATKDFRVLNFKEILQQHLIENPDRYLQPDKNSGGWGKFIKTEITNPIKKGSRAASYVPVKPKGGQAKKGGRGWLHTV
jgi:hypothetical protein